MFDGKKYLVTGGCGFIGSHLVEALCEKGALVTVVDDLSTGNRENLPSTFDARNLIVGDLCELDVNALDKLDGVFHFAAQSSVPLSLDDFCKSSKNNILSTNRAIDVCVRQKVPLVYASSSAVYGRLDFGNDKSVEVDLNTPYAADKYTNEIFTKMAETVYSLNSYGLRFFNVYGPKQDPYNPYSGVISIFLGRILSKENITIFGGEQSRDFVFVSDVVLAVLNAMAFLKNNHGAFISNVLSGKSTNIDELADIIMQSVGIKVKKTYQPLVPFEVLRSSGSSDSLIENLNFNTSVSLEEGLLKTADYIRKSNGKPYV